MIAVTNIEAIDNNHICENGIDALVFAPTTAKRAVISFSGMNKGQFQRWSWFYENFQQHDETLYIVFKDDDFLFYQGAGHAAMLKRYTEFIAKHLAKYDLSPADAYAVGSSMGGYAALFYAFQMGFAGVVAMNPLVDLESARRYEYYNWEKQMFALGPKWQDLHTFVYRARGKPRVYLYHGLHPADVGAVDKLVRSFEDLKITYTREIVPQANHSGYSMSKEYLFAVIDLWDQFKTTTIKA